MYFHAILNENSIILGGVHKGHVLYKAVHRYPFLCTKADLDIQQKDILMTLVSGAITKYINISFGNFYLSSLLKQCCLFLWHQSNKDVNNCVHIFVIITIRWFMFLIVYKYLAHKWITCTYKTFSMFSKFPLYQTCQVCNTNHKMMVKDYVLCWQNNYFV